MIPSGGTPTDLRLYRRPASTWWWTRKRSYFVFVMRELSSIFIAWFVVYLLLLIYAVGRGEAAYQRFLDWASSPWVTVLNLVALLFVLLHTVTWFSLTPQAMAVRVADRRVPAWHIIAGQYTGLAVVSGFVFWLVTR
jgi:fumarate reductase subunit C